MLFVTGSMAAANILVVRSAGPSAKSYPPGRSLPDNVRIALKANDTLVLLDARGTRTLRGPGAFTPGGPAQVSQRSAIGSIASGGPQRRARIGAVRNAGVIPRSPTIWHVDVTQSSTFCLADRNVMLWRPEAGDTVTLTVAPPSGPPQTMEWPAGQPTLAWPSQVRIADGTEYRLSWTGGEAPTRLRFKTLATAPADVPGVAAALIGNGCQAQLDLLVETVQPID